MQDKRQSTNENQTKKFNFDYNNDNQLSPQVKKALKNIIDNEKYVKYNTEVVEVSSNGGNYLANLFEVNITGETKDAPKKTNIFIKHVIPNERFCGIIQINEVYMTEVFCYTDLFKVYEKLQTEAEVPTEEMYRTLKCYNESNSNAIFMENLTKKGYTVLYRMKTISLKFAQMAIRELAKFHSLSFALQANMPNYFKKKIENKYFMVNFTEDWRVFACKNIDTFIHIFDADIQLKIKRLYPIIEKEYSKYLTKDISCVNCLCHGDYRPNNMMMKEIDGELEQILPIDYQAIFYGSPTTDLIFLIYLSTDSEFRKKHELELIELYHSTMKEFLLYFNIDSESVCPRKLFDADYDSFRGYGLMVALVLLPLCFSDEDNVRKDLITDDVKVDTRYYDRIIDIVNEFVRMGKL